MRYSARSCLCGRFEVVAIGVPDPWLSAHLSLATHQERECIYPPPRRRIRQAWPYQMETA